MAIKTEIKEIEKKRKLEYPVIKKIIINMNRERISELIPILKAFTQGLEIQCKGYQQDWYDVGDKFPMSETLQYRIKPLKFEIKEEFAKKLIELGVYRQFVTNMLKSKKKSEELRNLEQINSWRTLIAAAFDWETETPESEGVTFWNMIANA